MTDVLPLLTKMAEARSADAVWNLAAGHFAGHGFSRVVYRLSRAHRETVWPDPANRQFFSTLSPEFTRHYIESGLLSGSALHRWAEATEGACTWSWIPRSIAAGALSAKEVETDRLSRDLGIQAGISVSFPRFHARIRAALALIADHGLDHGRVEEIWAAHRDALLAVAHMMHLSLLHRPANPGRISLTPRQREALEWISDGKTTHDVALLMGVSPAMVEKHLRLARQALDVDTTAQAVARAITLNLLFPMRHTAQTYTKEVGNP